MKIWFQQNEACAWFAGELVHLLSYCKDHSQTTRQPFKRGFTEKFGCWNKPDKPTLQQMLGHQNKPPKNRKLEKREKEKERWTPCSGKGENQKGRSHSRSGLLKARFTGTGTRFTKEFGPATSLQKNESNLCMIVMKSCLLSCWLKYKKGSIVPIPWHVNKSTWCETLWCKPPENAW